MACAATNYNANVAQATESEYKTTTTTTTKTTVGQLVHSYLYYGNCHHCQGQAQPGNYTDAGQWREISNAMGYSSFRELAGHFGAHASDSHELSDKLADIVRRMINEPLS